MELGARRRDFGFVLVLQPILTTGTHVVAWPQGDQLLGGGPWHKANLPATQWWMSCGEVQLQPLKSRSSLLRPFRAFAPQINFDGISDYAFLPRMVASPLRPLHLSHFPRWFLDIPAHSASGSPLPSSPSPPTNTGGCAMSGTSSTSHIASPRAVQKRATCDQVLGWVFKVR